MVPREGSVDLLKLRIGPCFGRRQIAVFKPLRLKNGNPYQSRQEALAGPSGFGFELSQSGANLLVVG